MHDGQSAPLEFGLFDWLDENPTSARTADTYEQRLRVLRHADEAGFWGYHLAEHHGTPLGTAPSPGLFLAAAARETRRIRLGPLVYLLPLYDPVRLTQEICMLDHLTRGRLELGVGRGASPFELALYNVTPDETRAMYAEALEIILQGLRTGRMHHEGKYWTVKDVAITLRPWQTPYPPLWYPTNRPESIPWVASQGLGLLFTWNLPRSTTPAEQLAIYREHWQAHRDDPTRLNAHVAQPKYGFLRHILIADSDAEALAAARAAWPAHHGAYNYLWRLHGSDRHEHQADPDVLIEQKLLLVGSPATVRAAVTEQVVGSGCNYFVGAFTWGSLSTEQMLRSVDLFATEVMPAVRRAAAAAATA